MITLSHHIECLLLRHECVVVPQFGAFITLNNASSRVDSEDMFFPPLRVVRFHPDLTEDDGLLVESLRVALHQNATEAKRMVQRMVLDLRQQLLADGQVDFGSLGVFSQDEDGHVTFEPCQAGAITPAFFGLDAFVMPRLSALQLRSQDAARKEKVEAQDDSHITIRLNRRSLRYVAVTAAAILVGLLLSSPLAESENQSQQAAIVSTENPKATAAKTRKPAPVVEPVATVTSALKPEKTVEVQSHGEQHEPVATVAQPQPESAYCIVLASDVSQKNAEDFVLRLQKKGLQNASILQGKVRRVVITGFATETDAFNRNAEIHRMGGDFAYSWVMKL